MSIFFSVYHNRAFKSDCTFKCVIIITFIKQSVSAYQQKKICMFDLEEMRKKSCITKHFVNDIRLWGGRTEMIFNFLVNIHFSLIVNVYKFLKLIK